MKTEPKIQTILPALCAMSPFAFAKTRTERMLGEKLNEFAVDKNGWTHLHWAAAANDAHSALRLLKLGALPDSKNNGGADFGPEVKNRFAVLGLGDVEWGKERETPLGVAMRVRAFSAAFALIARGADVNAGNGVVTPLHWAAGYNVWELADFLIKKGADVNAGRGVVTPLHEAAWGNAPEVAELLISNGADVNAENGRGEMPLHIALGWGAIRVASLLIQNGADVNAKIPPTGSCHPEWKGYTPLHCMCMANRNGQGDLKVWAVQGNLGIWVGLTVRELLGKGADVNAKDKNGEAPLHLAARDGNASHLAKSLIAGGADVNAIGKYGRTPLHEAAKWNGVEMAEVLISNGADVNAKDMPGRTPLHWAAGFRAEGFLARKMVTMLINNGAIVDVKDNSGKAPSDVSYAAFRARRNFQMRPEGLLFSVLCCLHARPELGLVLGKSPPLLGTAGEEEAVEAVLSRLLFRGSGDDEGSMFDVTRWLHEDGFWEVADQVRDSRRYEDGSADPEEDFHRALRSLERRHAEKTGASKSVWLEKIRHDAEDDYDIPPLS